MVIYRYLYLTLALRSFVRIRERKELLYINKLQEPWSAKILVALEPKYLYS